MADFRDDEPHLELELVSATEAKNSFGTVLDKVMAQGRVGITKYDEVRAVVLSVREYEELLAKQHDPLQILQDDFEALVERMQAPSATQAAQSLFAASSENLGNAAVANAQRRG